MGQNLNIALVGAGAVGTFFSAHLAKGGANITICTRFPERYNQPILIDSCDGNFDFIPTNIIKLGCPVSTSFDVVILATKVLPSVNSVDLIAPYMTKQTILVLIQNGIFIESDLLKAYSQPIYRGLAFICSQRLSMTHIQHIDYGYLTLGPVREASDDVIVSFLMSLFEQASFKFNYESNIRHFIWEKLIWNAAFNPLSVLYGGVTTRALLDLPESRAQIRSIMNEIVQLAKLDGFDFHDAIIDYKLSQTEQMASYHTSMCLDYIAGRPIEIEAILGNVCRFADQLKVQIPMISKIYQQIVDLDR